MLQTKESIGRLDERVTFQQQVTGTNESNEDAQLGWVDSFSVWAEVEEVSGSEFYRADQLTGVKVAKIKIRYRAGVDLKQRIVIGNEVFNIVSILTVSRKGYIKIMAETGAVSYNEIAT